MPYSLMSVVLIEADDLYKEPFYPLASHAHVVALGQAFVLPCQ